MRATSCCAGRLPTRHPNSLRFAPNGRGCGYQVLLARAPAKASPQQCTAARRLRIRPGGSIGAACPKKTPSSSKSRPHHIGAATRPPTCIRKESGQRSAQFYSLLSSPAPLDRRQASNFVGIGSIPSTSGKRDPFRRQRPGWLFRQRLATCIHPRAGRLSLKPKLHAKRCTSPLKRRKKAYRYSRPDSVASRSSGSSGERPSQDSIADGRWLNALRSARAYRSGLALWTYLWRPQPATRWEKYSRPWAVTRSARREPLPRSPCLRIPSRKAAPWHPAEPGG